MLAQAYTFFPHCIPLLSSLSCFSTFFKRVKERRERKKQQTVCKTRTSKAIFLRFYVFPLKYVLRERKKKCYILFLLLGSRSCVRDDDDNTGE